MQAADVEPVSALQHALLAAFLLLVQLALLPLAALVLRRLLARREPSPMPWRAWHVWLVAAWILAGLIVTSIFLGLLDATPSTAVVLACSVVVLGSASALVVTIAFRSGAGWSALGVHAAGTVRSLLGS